MSKRAFAIGSVILGGILMIGASSYFLLDRHLIPTLARRSSANSDLKTCAVAAQNYSFKYPKAWVPTSRSGSCEELESPDTAKAWTAAREALAVNGDSDIPLPVDFAVLYWPSFEAFMQANPLPPAPGTAPQNLADYTTVINGGQASETVGVGGQHGYLVDALPDGGPYDIFIDHGGIYELTFPQPSADGNLSSDEQNVLSSFTFTN